MVRDKELGTDCLFPKYTPWKSQTLDFDNLCTWRDEKGRNLGADNKKALSNMELVGAARLQSLRW